MVYNNGFYIQHYHPLYMVNLNLIIQLTERNIENMKAKGQQHSAFYCGLRLILEILRYHFRLGFKEVTIEDTIIIRYLHKLHAEIARDFCGFVI